MCQTDRNINYVYDDATARKINTEVAEQRNSVLKQYKNALSSYSSKKVRIMYLMLFHLMNTERNKCDNEFEYSRKYSKGKLFDLSWVVLNEKNKQNRKYIKLYLLLYSFHSLHRFDFV